jgi:hypothetical protein
MKLLFENWRKYLNGDPAEEVIDALVDLGGEEDGMTVRGPSPIKEISLSTQNGVIWIHWVEGDGTGGAWKFLHSVISQVAPNIPVALEANYIAAPFWLKQGFDEISMEEAEEIYPHIEPDNSFFQKEPEGTRVVQIT